MKKVFFAGLFFLLLLASVSAVTVDCDGPGWWNSDFCQDYELQDEFDEVTDDINDNSDDIGLLNDGQGEQWLVIEDNQDDIIDTNDYISSKENKWSKDLLGGGISLFRVKEYLFSEFIDYLKELFVTKDDLALSEARVVLGRGASQDDLSCYAALLRADQEGHDYSIDGHLGFPGGVGCLKVI